MDTMFFKQFLYIASKEYISYILFTWIHLMNAVDIQMHSDECINIKSDCINAVVTEK